MKKIYYSKCKEYRKYKISEISYLFDKPLIIYIICKKWDNKHKRIFNEEKSIKTMIGLIKNIKLLLKYGKRKRKPWLYVEKKKIKQEIVSKKHKSLLKLNLF